MARGGVDWRGSAPTRCCGGALFPPPRRSPLAPVDPPGPRRPGSRCCKTAPGGFDRHRQLSMERALHERPWAAQFLEGNRAYAPRAIRATQRHLAPLKRGHLGRSRARDCATEPVRTVSSNPSSQSISVALALSLPDDIRQVQGGFPTPFTMEISTPRSTQRRAAHQGATLADLYDPEVMPPNLRRAHQALDRAVDRVLQTYRIRFRARACRAPVRAV